MKENPPSVIRILAMVGFLDVRRRDKWQNTTSLAN